MALQDNKGCIESEKEDLSGTKQTRQLRHETPAVLLPQEPPFVPVALEDSFPLKTYDLAECSHHLIDS